MQLKYDKITIRNATVEDAQRLSNWWNNGAIMEHEGFPNGLGTTTEEVEEKIKAESDKSTRLHIILYDNRAIGEMNYRDIGNNMCEIGIKICDIDMQNKGLGKVILSIFIDELFNERGYQKIVLNTNLNNKRAQHVYEQLGFQKIRINLDSWKEQLGDFHSSVDYELKKQNYVSYL